MRTVLSILAGLVLTAFGNSYAAEPVTVKGRLQIEKPYPRPDTIWLFEVVEGSTQVLSQTCPDAEGNFGFTFTPPYSGFYVIGWGHPMSPENKHRFYFEGGERLEATFRPKEAELTGTLNSPENRLLSLWDQASAEVSRGAVYGPRKTFRTFFPLITRFAAENGDWMDGHRSGNPRFDRLMELIVPADIVTWAMIFMTSPNSEHPVEEDYRSSFYNDIDPAAYLADTTLLAMPFGRRTINGLLLLPMRLGQSEDYASTEEALSMIGSPRLKGVYLMGRASMLRSRSEIERFISEYGHYLTPEHIAGLEETIASLHREEAAMSGIDFTFTDMEGNEVSLSDFRGKVVYLDIWATWCGPCRAEFPYLKAVEKKYHGNEDVVFIGVSVDKPENREKWAQMVKDEALEGIQLFAGGQDKIPAEYNMAGIPRFILFDRDGRVSDSRAPRPSSGSLESAIDALLK